ncbi:MAG TPA: 3-deoxy-8-phosphooctulonate synthase, partial [Synergistaceae bacterium]|nr:3-deoxy-8-phosphooctulonate synthase [Synergistaceae bacterium]
GTGKLTLFAGPCVLESLEGALEIAEELQKICASLGVQYVFKASFDKANRTSLSSYRGPGLEEGLRWLSRIRDTLKAPIITDIHEPWQAEVAAEVASILQIPAFLCRQTDLLVAAARTGRPVNVKKAQFLDPRNMAPVVQKLRDSGASQVMLCERGTSFGYGQLVVDFRSLPLMRSLGCPVVFDATHSVQMPGGKGNSSGGDRRFVPVLARAAASVGMDALFAEVHPDPEKALSDGPNMIPLKHFRPFLEDILEVHTLAWNRGFASLDFFEEPR